MNYGFNRTWAEIDLDNIVNNINEIRRIIEKNTDVCCVVKADAYGHGAVAVSKILEQNGVKRFAVALFEEAMQLRKNGINGSILILGYVDPANTRAVLANDLTQTVFSMETAEALSNEAVQLGTKAKIHIKVDTGLSRVGFSHDSSIKALLDIARLPGIMVEGIFTHFASADEVDKTYTKNQIERFTEICGRLEKNGVVIPIKHMANSAGLLQYPEAHLNMIRPGIALYGMYPSKDVDTEKLKLKPAMTLKSKIHYIKDVQKNTPVSYGRTFTTSRLSKIATIPIGYADGYPRRMSGAQVLVNGEFAQVVGRVCMDHCMIDVTDLSKDANLGDEVVLFGAQGDRIIPVEDIASKLDTINYEVVCMVGKRIPRIYMQNGQVVDVMNGLA